MPVDINVDDGEDINVICHAKPLYEGNGQIVGYLGSLSDISELKSVQLQLEQLALYDPLTKLANRHLFRNRLEKALKHAEREGSMIALLFLDTNFTMVKKKKQLGASIDPKKLISTGQ